MLNISDPKDSDLRLTDEARTALRLMGSRQLILEYLIAYCAEHFEKAVPKELYYDIGIDEEYVRMRALCSIREGIIVSVDAYLPRMPYARRCFVVRPNGDIVPYVFTSADRQERLDSMMEGD